jgi:hypothetical protein
LLSQELETVVADRDSLQRQLAAQSAEHEAETRQLHADKTDFSPSPTCALQTHTPFALNGD